MSRDRSDFTISVYHRRDDTISSCYSSFFDGMIPSLAVTLAFSTKTGHDADELLVAELTCVGARPRCEPVSLPSRATPTAVSTTAAEIRGHQEAVCSR